MDKNRPFSWSQISSFEYDPEQWRKRYVLREPQTESGAMSFGKEIGEKYSYEPGFVTEYKLEARLDKINLIGYIDAFDLENKKLIELKTGKKWDKKKAQSHGQIDLYCAMIYAMHKIRPEELDIKLIWLATEQDQDFSTKFIADMKPVIFPLKKTMLDVITILARVKRVVKEMDKYVKSYPQL